MKIRLLLTITAALIGLSPALAATQPASGIMIVNSGSTNMAGYQITVLPNGNMAYGSGGNISSATLPPALTMKLFSDAQAALPFAQLALKPCMKSASFGSATRLVYKNDTSPDISCPGNPKAATLYGDVHAIQQAAGISLLPRRQFPLPFTGQKN